MFLFAVIKRSVKVKVTVSKNCFLNNVQTMVGCYTRMCSVSWTGFKLFQVSKAKHTGNSNWRSAKCTNRSYWLQHAQPQCVLWLADTDSYVLSIQPWVPKGCCPTFNLSGRKTCRCTSNHQDWHYLQNLFRSVNRLSVTIFLSQIIHISWMLVIVHKISVVCCFACGTAWDGSWR